MKLKNKWILWLMFCILLTITGCERKGKSRNFEMKSEMKEVVLLETDITKENLCVVTDWMNRGYALSIIPKRYIVLIEARGKENSSIEGTDLILRYFYKNYNVNVYSLETCELVKSYGLKDLKKNMPSDYHIRPALTISFRSNGQDYIKVETSYVGQDSELMHGKFWLIINVDTDEMRFLDADTYFDDLLENSEKAVKFDNQLHIFLEWTQEPNYFQFLNANGFVLFDEEASKAQIPPFRCVTGWNTQGFQNEGIAEVTITTYDLPKENKELYSKFPGLKEYQGKEGLVAQIYLGDYPSAEEIMKLFLEEGQEISFEGCVMDGKYSIDGLPHEINSFEEFERWYKPKEY